jgi:hypothetical protein
MGMGSNMFSGGGFGGMQVAGGYGGMALPTSPGSWHAFQQPQSQKAQSQQAQPTVTGSSSGPSSVDELMSKTIAGVSKLSLDTRAANQRRWLGYEHLLQDFRW